MCNIYATILNHNKNYYNKQKKICLKKSFKILKESVKGGNTYTRSHTKPFECSAWLDNLLKCRKVSVKNR